MLGLRSIERSFHPHPLDVYTVASIWRENMLANLSGDIICSEKRSKQIFSPNGGYRVFIRQIFFATRAVLKIKEYHSDIPQF